MKLQPYPEYKNSGVNWLDVIPSNWNFLRSKVIFHSLDIRSETGNEELLSVSERYGVTPRKNVNVTMFEAASYQNYKLCWLGDLVINSLWAWMQGLGFSKYHGIVSTAYGVYRLNQENVSDYRYFDYLLRSAAYRWELRVRSKGIWRSRYQLRDNDFLTMPILIPGTDEQAQIACFLDWKTSQINKFIHNKRRLIELLKEQKQNIINQAVTKGINPNVKLKSSGVEWIGDVPEHWNLAPLKHLASINSRVLLESTDSSYTFKYLDISSVGTGYLVKNPEILHFGHAPSRARRILKKGDTIISTVRTYLKSIYYVPEEVENWIASTGFAVLAPKKKIHPSFLSLLIQSDHFISQAIRESVGIAYPSIAEAKLGALHLAYPESIEEQQEIAQFIIDSSNAINQIISRAEREIELIREYRIRLISDVVTGKVDVRGIAVPEVDEQEALALAEEVAETKEESMDEENMDEAVGYQ